MQQNTLIMRFGDSLEILRHIEEELALGAGGFSSESSEPLADPIEETPATFPMNVVYDLSMRLEGGYPELLFRDVSWAELLGNERAA